MKQSIKDTAGLGTALWLIGYLASLVLFFTPYAGIMGWILLAIFTPVRKRERLPLRYYAGVGVAWMLIAIALDYLFIVLLFHANYYGIDVFVYYAVTFLIPWASDCSWTGAGVKRWEIRDNGKKYDYIILIGYLRHAAACHGSFT